MNRILFLAILILATGCGTVRTKSKGGWGIPYSGFTCSGFATAMAVQSANWGELLVPFFLADTIVSGAIDTLLLPVDIPKKAKKKREDACLEGIHL